MSKSQRKFNEIPRGWEIAFIDDITLFITDFQANGSFAALKQNVRQYSEPNYAVLVRLKDLRKGLKDLDNFRYTDEQGYNFLYKSELKQGDILVSNVGSIGVTYQMPKIDLPATLAPNMFKVVLSENISDLYFIHYSQGISFFNDLKEVAGSSTSQPKINKTQYRKIPIPIPPLNEQHRIVAKIEELLSGLENGISYLKSARRKLKIYRQVILKYAFEGKLTSKGRESNSLDQTSPLIRLIDEARLKHQTKILDEWNRAVKNWEIQGKVSKKPVKPRFNNKYNPITPEELSGLVELPQGWRWIKLARMSEIVGGVTKGRNLKGQNLVSVPYLRVANVQDGYLDLSSIKMIDVPSTDVQKYQLIKGDILYTEGGDKDKLGRGTIWNDEIENCIHQNHIFRSRLYHEKISPKYIAYFSQTQEAKNYFFKNAKQTTNLASINLKVLSNLPIPLPPIDEQIQIIQELESLLSVYDKLVESIELGIRKADILKQSILKKAFRGKLVNQDPEDEASDILLEKIKLEKDIYMSNQKLRSKENSSRRTKVRKDLSIEKLLLNSEKPVLVSDIWRQSKYYEEDIEGFYAELKKLGSKIDEIRDGIDVKLQLKV